MGSGDGRENTRESRSDLRWPVRRIVVTLLHEKGKRGSKRGLASLCIGGGLGVAICLERRGRNLDAIPGRLGREQANQAPHRLPKSVTASLERTFEEPGIS
ncbi:MAG: hypothetical protein E5Y30_40650 [Mesorhizobium sp.]|nr:MAG: hypothetical protein E5Y30_40650 [Mesorhizobium sp.]TIU42603.1 MAG: hypothetical protein E5W26_01075 [Mesorhizobium sp.]